MLALQPLSTNQHRTKNFKALLKDTFHVYRKVGFFALKFRLLDNFIKDLDCFRCLTLLCSSAYKHFNIQIKRVYRATSKLRISTIEEIISAIDTNTHSRKQKLHKTQMTTNSALSGKLSFLSSTGPIIVNHGSKTTARCIERSFQTEHAPGSAGPIAANYLTVLGTDTTWTFVSISRDVVQKPCSQLLRDTELEHVKPAYVLGGLMREFNHRDRADRTIEKPPTYPKWPMHIFRTVKLGARKTLKNKLGVLLATSHLSGRLRISKILLLFRMETPDLASADEVAFFHYMECRYLLDTLDETLACVFLR